MNESKKKNILIGGLLAIVLVMAVGYAAFATQLNIQGSTSITKNWVIEFDNSNTKQVASATSTDVEDNGDAVMDVTAGGTGTPTGQLVINGDKLNATVTTVLTSPGDSVVYTLYIKNTGDFNATAATPVLAWHGSETGSINGLVATCGHIKYTVTAPTPTTIAKTNGVATMTVTAEYDTTTTTAADDTTELTGNISASSETAGLDIHLIYTQAAES